jgi:hypothetical protein
MLTYQLTSLSIPLRPRFEHLGKARPKSPLSKNFHLLNTLGPTESSTTPKVFCGRKDKGKNGKPRNKPMKTLFLRRYIKLGH